MTIWRLASTLATALALASVGCGTLEVKVTSVKCEKLDCGGRNAQWIFELSDVAPCDGYFVQQIDRVFDIRECDAEVAHVTTETYWEAWNVTKGDKKEAHASQFTFTDSSTQPSRNGKQGKTVSAGVIKFFCSTTTGDLGDMNVAPASSASAWGPGKVAGSGSQPSTGEKPAWWDTVPEAKAATRSATSTWICCPDRPRKNELECDPK